MKGVRVLSKNGHEQGRLAANKGLSGDTDRESETRLLSDINTSRIGVFPLSHSIMPPDTHHTQPDIQDQQALPAEVLEDVVSYLTRGLDVLDMTIAAEMKWLGQLDSHKLSDVPLDVSSSFCHFVDMAVMVLESNGFTSSALGYRSHSTEFQEKLKEFRHKTNESYLKILEDAKEALLAASLDASVKNNITQSKVAIGSTRAKVLRNGNALFIHSSWYPVVSLPSSSLVSV